MPIIITSCECGSTEFITVPNQYDVYEIVDGQLGYSHTEYVNDEFTLYCRECGQQIAADKIGRAMEV